jgi:hypothetical protein
MDKISQIINQALRTNDFNVLSQILNHRDIEIYRQYTVQRQNIINMYFVLQEVDKYKGKSIADMDKIFGNVNYFNDHTD